jgi:hypothetical protein
MYLSSLEVPWFWAGGVDAYSGLKSAFEGVTPVKRRSDVREVR